MNQHENINEIIEAASQIFTIYGYEDTSINEICKMCNISKGKFYYYFNDKEDLFTACCTHAYSIVNEIFDLFRFDENSSFKENLINLFFCYQKVFEKHSFLLYIIYSIHSTQQPAIKDKIAEITRYRQHKFTLLVEKMASAFSINVSAFEMSLCFHMAFMSAYEAEGVLDREELPGLNGHSIYDYFVYFLDKVLYGLLPRDEETMNNPKAARKVSPETQAQ